MVIIGGGIGGLSAAYRWRERHPDAKITVIEAQDQWGGVTQSADLDACRVELGPDSIIRTKPAALRLIDDLGLSDQVYGTQPTARQSYIAKGRRLIPVPPGLYLLAPGRWWPFITSPLVSWAGKLRMGLDLFLPRRKTENNPPSSESAPERSQESGQPEESLATFVRRRLGKEALDRIAQPMVSGIYTADPEQLSLQATMPQFIEMEREHRSLLLAMRRRAKQQAQAMKPQSGGGSDGNNGSNSAGEQASGPRYGLFASLKGGLGGMTDALVAQLSEQDLRLSTHVQAIRVITTNGELFVRPTIRFRPTTRFRLRALISQRILPLIT